MQPRATHTMTFPIRRPALRVIAARGEGFPGRLEPLGAPEQPMVVSFEGLTETQQRAALAAFPGGRRFRLANS
jgi:hypothetical protein